MKRGITILFVSLLIVTLLPVSSLAQNLSEFWGMTYDGTNGGGVIFKTDGSANNLQLVRPFNLVPGQNPDFTHLCQASNGKLYGMTYLGGSSNMGILFEYNPSTNVYIKKLDFTGTSNGANPHGSLIKASNNKLYGMTYAGGKNGLGVLFEYDPSTDIYAKKLDFTGTTNGSNPYNSLVQASNGKFYGMTYNGGANSLGVIFEFDPSTNTYVKKVDFAGTTNGSHPYGSLIQASNGKLYGMTQLGGTSGTGVMFEFDPSTNTFTKKLDFVGTSNGSYPYGSLVQAGNGKLYGMTYYGGASGAGVLFEYDLLSSVPYTKKLDFAGTTNGGNPQGELFNASNNKLYGLTAYGGASNNGVFFEYNPVTNTYIKRVDFAGTTNGSRPFGTVMQAGNGKLYGLTYYGGSSGQGVLFEYDTATTSFTKKLDFLAGSSEGLYPYGSLVKGSNEKLYGMTNQGGTSNFGVLFEFDPATSLYTKKTDFSGTTNGSRPFGALVQANNGKFYGMTQQGGTSSNGILFSYDPSTNIQTKLVDFAGTTNGALPYGSLVKAINGKLYGLTYQGGTNNFGILFEFDPNTNTFIKRVDFAGATNGSNPRGSLMVAQGGKLYGMTYNGGVNNYGVLFVYNPYNNTFTKKIDFSYTALGAYPMGALVQTSNGKLYGMTYSGGASGNGVLFKYDTATGTCSKELDFAGATNGSQPYGSLLYATNGKLYGMTYQGGINNLGVLFQYDPVSTGFTKKVDFNGANGKNPTYSQLIEVCQQPTFLARIGNTAVCPGNNTKLISKVSGNGITYQWQVNNGMTTIYSNLTNNSTYAGVNDDTLLISNAQSTMNGYKYRCVITSTCPVKTVYSDTAILNVYPKPVASFTINNNIQCLKGNSFAFNNTSSIASKYLWYFGDGDTSLIKSPTHAYKTSGTFTVKLVAMVTYSCKDSSTATLDVNPQPVSSFTISNASQCITGNNFMFTNTSSGAVSYLWEFGDASTSTSSSPSHSYSNPGTYKVKLISTSNFGCKDTGVVSVYVRTLPGSAFSINNNSQCLIGNNFVFTNNTSSGISYNWNFGDASGSTATSPSHIFTVAGSYNVKLVSTSSYGCKDSITNTVDVRPQPVPSFTINNKTQCLSGNYFVFTNTTAGTTTSLWDFGDGSPTTNFKSPYYTYSAMGTYNVKLVSTTTYGCKDSTTKAVVVIGKPVASFSINNISQCLTGNNFIFTNSSTGATSFLWSFGDGDTSSITSPSHKYSSTGAMNVKLVALVGTVCKDSMIKSINVRPQPLAAFSVNNNMQCLSVNNFAFTNKTTGATSYFWSFGDGSPNTTLTSPSHTYTTLGSYVVKLIASTTYGCKDSALKNVDIVPKPVSSFTINNNSQCLKGNNFVFTNTTTGAQSFLWNFGNGDTTSKKSPSYSYKSVNTYYVKLISMVGNSCKDSVTKSLDVREHPVSSFTINNNTQCLKANSFVFTNTTPGSATYIWLFGDGGTSAFTSPTYSYSAGGIYTVNLISTNSYGCSDTAKLNVNVLAPKVFLGNDTTIYGTNSLLLDAGAGFDAYLWSTYTSGRTYTVNSNVNGFGLKIFSVRVTLKGCFGYDTIKVNIKKFNTINDHETLADIYAYPNPVSDILYLSMGSISNEISINISDISGKLLKSVRLKPNELSSVHQIDLSEIAQGIYLLDISGNSFKKQIKIIKY